MPSKRDALLHGSIRAAHGRETCDEAGRPLSTYICTYHEGFSDALDLLDSLPVGLRMAAVGMEPSGWSGHRRVGRISRVHDKNSVHMDGCIPLYAEVPCAEG